MKVRINYIEYGARPSGPIRQVGLVGTAQEFRQMARDMEKLCHSGIPDDYCMMLDLPYQGFEEIRSDGKLSAAK